MEEVEENTRERGNGDAWRCTKQVSKREYPKKRRAHNKMSWFKKKLAALNQVKQSAVASKKVKRIKTPREWNLQSFRLFDITVLGEVFSCLCYPECFETGSLYIEEDEDRRKMTCFFLEYIMWLWV